MEILQNSWDGFEKGEVSEKEMYPPKNCPQKQHTYGSLELYFFAAPTAQNTPELKIHVRNVAQDTSVYYSVVNTFIYFYEIKNTTSITKQFPFLSRNLLQGLIRHFPSIFHFSWKKKKLRYKL